MSNAADRPSVGVGLFVIGPDGRFVIIRRKGAHGAGDWALVGGHMEHGQSPEEAAAMEAAEEMGLRIDPADIHRGPYTNDVFRAEGKHYVTLFCWAALPSGQEPVIAEPDKLAEWRWASFEDMPRSPERVFLPLANLLRTGFRPTLPGRPYA